MMILMKYSRRCVLAMCLALYVLIACAGSRASVPVDAATDCAFKRFAVEYAEFLLPAQTSIVNATALVADALNITGICRSNETDDQAYRRSRAHLPAVSASVSVSPSSCASSVFVSVAGSDVSGNGSVTAPLQTVQFAVRFVRRMRGTLSAGAVVCILLRGGTYYVGASASESSQIGAIRLSAADSHLRIAAFADERVVLSGGVIVPTDSFSVYKRIDASHVIYRAPLPAGVRAEWPFANEVYVDGARAIRAKFPNGDPVTGAGVSSDIAGWLKDRNFTAATEIHVGTPSAPSQIFANFSMGIGGPANNFHPPQSVWATANPSGGSAYTYGFPNGIIYGPTVGARASQWLDTSVGHVFAYQGFGWASWMFDIANVTNSSIVFGRGGFQEARGAGTTGGYYVENIFEELDDLSEWFINATTRSVYYMPAQSIYNVSLIVSQSACILSIRGDRSFPVEDVVISGINFRDTSNTFMSAYEVPSGGDFAIHRGGAVVVTGTRNVRFERCTFTLIGGNAILISDWNDNTTITQSHFNLLGDNGIVIVGRTSGIDGATNDQQPNRTAITHNLFANGGVYVKQTAFIAAAISRALYIRGNIMFNVPRAAININDGFAGGHLISDNLIFNTVTQTGDHGPVNSWDRLPYLLFDQQSGEPTLTAEWSNIRRNLLIADHNAINGLDHDDGSAHYNDTANFLLYSGSKDLFGHDKLNSANMFIYPDVGNEPWCGGWFSGDEGFVPWGERWTNNRCFLYQTNQTQYIAECDAKNLTRSVPSFATNQYFLTDGQTPLILCGDTAITLTEWQQRGHDVGSKVFDKAEAETIIQWGRQLLMDA